MMAHIKDGRFSTAHNSGIGGVGFVIWKAKCAFSFSPVSERLATLRLTVEGLVVAYAPTKRASKRESKVSFLQGYSKAVSVPRSQL